MLHCAHTAAAWAGDTAGARIRPMNCTGRDSEKGRSISISSIREFPEMKNAAFLERALRHKGDSESADAFRHSRETCPVHRHGNGNPGEGHGRGWPGLRKEVVSGGQGDTQRQRTSTAMVSEVRRTTTSALRYEGGHPLTIPRYARKRTTILRCATKRTTTSRQARP